MAALEFVTWRWASASDLLRGTSSWDRKFESRFCWARSSWPVPISTTALRRAMAEIRAMWRQWAPATSSTAMAMTTRADAVPRSGCTSTSAGGMATRPRAATKRGNGEAAARALVGEVAGQHQHENHLGELRRLELERARRRTRRRYRCGPGPRPARRPAGRGCRGTAPAPAPAACGSRTASRRPCRSGRRQGRGPGASRSRACPGRRWCGSE